MAGIGEISCFVDSANTGFGRCVPRPGKLLYEIAIPKGETFTAADVADFETTLNTLLIEDNKTERGYLLGKYVSVEDGSADDVREAFDAGVETTLYDGAYIWTRRAINGGFCIQKAFRKFNGTQDQYDWLLVFQATDKDARYYIAGRKVYNSTTAAYEMGGIRYDDVFAPKWMAATGTTSAMYRLRTVMGDVRQLNEDFIFTPVDFEVGDLNRVQDVTLTATKNTTATYDVTAVLGCNGQNLAELYPALADDAAWLAKAENSAGAAITVTGVTIVAGKFRVVLDNADADFTSATNVYITMQPISVTSASPFNVEFVESNYVILAK
jgi:hypothetical protein